MSHIFAYTNGKAIFFNETLNKVHKNTFSGGSAYSNDEKFMNLKNKGPIPVGTYSVTSFNNGIAMLTPEDDTDILGREFLAIHTAKDISNHTADGCIITNTTMMDGISIGDVITVTNDMTQIPEIEGEEKEDENAKEEEENVK
jgi:hypothetical protein